MRSNAATRNSRRAVAKPTAPSLPQRMPLGTMFLGPDYYGCIGTGLRPAILKSSFLRDHESGYRFAIGPEIFVQDAVARLVRGRVPRGQAFVEFDEGRRRVTFCKTYVTAKTRFRFLCKEIDEDNAKQRRTHRRLLTRARNGDANAILRLSDF